MKDTTFRILGQLAIIILSLCLFYLDSIIADGISLGRLIVYLVANTFLLWEALRLSIILIRKKYPGTLLTRQRLILVGIITLLIVAVSPFIRFFIGDIIHLYGRSGAVGGDVFSYLRIIGQNIFYCLFIAAAYEAIYFFEQWKKAFAESVVLKKETIQGQLNTLRNQVSPHFLFNTLNTLSMLIRKDPDKAEKFVEEMADVYRYLLQVNEKELVPLRDELNFISSFAHLLRARFNNHFQLAIDVEGRFREYLLPPLVLQLLIENAIKHNIVSAKYPLTVSIQMDRYNRLVVSNPVRKKNEPIGSTRTGLNNIVSRYRLLNLSSVEIVEQDECFVVTLPLYTDKNNESINN